MNNNTESGVTETKIKWKWCLHGYAVGGYSGFILDEYGFMVAEIATIQGGHKIQPILEHIVSIHNASLEVDSLAEFINISELTSGSCPTK